MPSALTVFRCHRPTACAVAVEGLLETPTGDVGVTVFGVTGRCAGGDVKEIAMAQAATVREGIDHFTPVLLSPWRLICSTEPTCSGRRQTRVLRSRVASTRSRRPTRECNRRASAMRAEPESSAGRSGAAAKSSSRAGRLSRDDHRQRRAHLLGPRGLGRPDDQRPGHAARDQGPVVVQPCRQPGGLAPHGAHPGDRRHHHDAQQGWRRPCPRRRGVGDGQCVPQLRPSPPGPVFGLHPDATGRATTPNTPRRPGVPPRR